MSKPKNQPPDPERIRALALDLIASQSTMTLATAGDADPWAAPVYYVFHKSIFYFFSSPDSRHVVEALPDGRIAAAVFHPADSWKNIRGLQMSGRIDPLSPGLKAIQVVKAYLKRYPFTRDFFKPGDSIDLETFRQRFRVRLYGFAPDKVLYMDNQISFGFREPVQV